MSLLSPVTKKRLMTLISAFVLSVVAASANGEVSDDIHREVTQGKIAAAMVLYLEAEVFKSESRLDLELAKSQSRSLSHVEGKIIASLVQTIEESLEKVRTDLDKSYDLNRADLEQTESDIKKINKLISEINS